MTLLSASFGKYASAPMGWFFMLGVVLIEILIMSKILSSRRHIILGVITATTISNIVSGAVGALISKTINNGWMLVIWFPWVSSNEVDTNNPESLFNFVVFFIASLATTIIIEVLLNWLMLRKRGFKPVMRATIVSNVISTIIACFLLYSYSFFFYD